MELSMGFQFIFLGFIGIGALGAFVYFTTNNAVSNVGYSNLEQTRDDLEGMANVFKYGLLICYLLIIVGLFYIGLKLDKAKGKLYEFIESQNINKEEITP